MRLIGILVLTWLAMMAVATHGATTPQPPATLTVRGQLALPVVAERPAGGQVVVELRDTRADRVLAEQRLPLDEATPTQPFQLQLRRDRLPRGHLVSVRGALLTPHGAEWLSEPVTIDPTAASVDLGLLQLARAPRPLAFQTYIDCRIRQFVVGMAGDTLTLRDGEQTFALQPSATNPDQRFEAVADPSTFVHTAGTSATVAIRGVIYAGCSLLR
jgi:hypothetical protein